MLLKSNMSFNKLKITKMFTYSVIEFNKLKFVLKYVKNSILWNNVDTKQNEWDIFAVIFQHCETRIF